MLRKVQNISWKAHVTYKQLYGLSLAFLKSERGGGWRLLDMCLAITSLQGKFYFGFLKSQD